MSSGPLPAPPWRGPSPTPAPPGLPWRSPPPRVPYRPRWRRLALVAALGLAALAVATWVVFWIRPPAPARVVILRAGYDRTLAVPPNPYGKADARELATLARPGSWFGTRSRLVGGSTGTLTRTGLPDLSTVREKCVVVFVAAHGGRDRDGPFLFPEDSTGEPADRVRFKTLLEQLDRLPTNKQKLLIIDATHAPAFAELGLVHNDFAAAVEEMEAEIAAVPNLAVFLSSGPDERSWTSPEWGTSCFAHFVLAGLNGAADVDGNRRVTVGELVSYVAPQVSAWARDNRGARQVPLLLPKADGADRVRTMHLVSVDAAAAGAAPEPFEPPPELEARWKEYRELATATPPPTAYTPHLWRQYEAWVLRHEELILANDADGAKVARAEADEACRKIKAARPLDVAPQTLALRAAVGGRPYRAVSDEDRSEIRALAMARAAEREKKWADLRAKCDTETRLRWGRALVEWVAVRPIGDDPAGVERGPRLTVARELIPLLADGLAVRPAELNFVEMLARHLPPPDQKEAIGPLLARVLELRLKAERAAACCEPERSGEVRYPFAEFLYPYAECSVNAGDAVRRGAEDRCFATDPAAWSRALDALDREKPFDRSAGAVDSAREALVAWHRGAHSQVSEAEWAARRLNGAAAGPFLRPQAWERLHVAGRFPALVARAPHPDTVREVVTAGDSLTDRLTNRGGVATDAAQLLEVKPEFD
ncbi:MAG: caspase family protein, partial [Planctomycetes bacterium]|nr:caspase family protein [Planctomycetota bacterium]